MWISVFLVVRHDNNLGPLFYLFWFCVGVAATSASCSSTFECFAFFGEHLAPLPSCGENVCPGAEVLTNQRPQSIGALHSLAHKSNFAGNVIITGLWRMHFPRPGIFLRWNSDL